MGLKQLSEEIIKLSTSDKWEEAKKEWTLNDITYANEPETCLCGHYPIKELCIIRNTKNDALTVVGNSCINRFLGINSNKIFVSVNNVRKNITKSLTIDFVQLVHDREKISYWELNFYRNIWRKRNLSNKQMIVKCKINLKILDNIKVTGKPFIDDEQKKLYQQFIDDLISLSKVQSRKY